MAASVSGRRSSLMIIFTTVFVDLLGFGIVLPLLPYYAHQLHASGMAAGALIARVLGDAVRRRAVVGALVRPHRPAAGVARESRGLDAVVPPLRAGRRTSNGCSCRAFSPAWRGPTSRWRRRSSPTRRASRSARAAWGLIGAAFGLGFVFGPVIGGLLAHYGHAAPGFAATIICGLNFVAAVFRLPESLAAGAAPGTPRRASAGPVARRAATTAAAAAAADLHGRGLFVRDDGDDAVAAVRQPLPLDARRRSTGCSAISG